MLAAVTRPRITDVETIVAPFSGGTWLDESQVSTPLSAFDRFGQRRSSWRGPGADLVNVLVSTEDPDVFGVGQTRGGRVVERLILDHLRPLVCGQDPREVRIRYEEMVRATSLYAAGGIGSMAVSAVELASWDLLARSLDAPLYRVLGGAAAPIPYYLTCAAGSSPGAAVGSARAVKIAVPCGPPDGPAGMQQNVDALAALRSAVGPEPPLAVDCFMSWDVPYTVEFVRRTADLGLLWIEEPLPVDAVDNHVALRQLISPVRVAAGEHLFIPSMAYRYLDRGAVDVLQVDVTWCGGIHVASALAAATISRGVTFAPHSGGLQPWAVHLLSTLGPLGLAEVLTDVTTDPGGIPPMPTESPGVGIDPSDLGFAPMGER